MPLIVLTADRPPELRDVGAGQTIDQLKLYGDAVKWFVEVGVHEATAANLRWIRTLACRAYWTALEGRPGPVHLNFPLREPLILSEPLPDDGHAAGPTAPVGAAPARRPVAPPPAPAAPRCRRAARAAGVVVAGRYERDRDFGAAVAQVRRARRVPAARRPAVGRAARTGGDRRTTTCSCATPRFTARARPGARDPRRRSADLQAAAHLARRPDRAAGPGRDRPRGRLAGPRRRPGREPRRRPGRRRSTRGARRARRSIRTGSPRWRAADDAAVDDDRSSRSATSSPSRWSPRALGEWLPPDGDAVRRLLDADPRRRAVRRRSRTRAARTLSNRGANGIDGTVSSRVRRRRRERRPGRPADRRRRARPRHRRPARRPPPGAQPDDRAAQQRRRRDLPLPPGRRRERRIRGARRDAARPRLLARGARCTGAPTSAPPIVEALRAAVERSIADGGTTIIEVAHRPRGEPRAPPPHRRGGAQARDDRAARSAGSTGSSAWSLTSVSASSAAGSESRTIPQPA